MSRTLIGLAGRARVGKDTVADMLIPFGFRKVAFADPIRNAVAEMFGVSRHIIYADGMKTRPILPGVFADHVTPRYLMQTLGTEWGRQIVDEDIWLKLVQTQWEHGSGSMVVSDVRFDNEADWIRMEGGQVWHIRRELRAEVGGIEGHASERGVTVNTYTDKVVVNDESLQDLQAQVMSLLNSSGTR